MRRPSRHIGPRAPCEIVDFDAALLEACPAGLRAELMVEAELLVGVFAPDREPDRLAQMASQLSAGARDSEMNRAHARKLAAALKRIAQAEQLG